ncbi:hypothetical protein [Anaerorhabdus sp.]|uniref:hypothetical protein n=1 Tax=Anaerorhabdus sp. TaxID=1872524 RepID=UPI002FC6B24D
MKKLRKVLIVLIGIFLLTIPFVWSLVTSGYLFTKYEEKSTLIFDNKEVSIGANCNSFSIHYNGRNLKQNYAISKDGLQLLLITPSNLDIFTDSNEKIKSVTEFSSNEEACGNLNFEVFILERDKDYIAQNSDKTGLVYTKGENYHINEEGINELLSVVQNWNETTDTINLDDYQVIEEYNISLDASEILIDTTKGDQIHNSIDLQINSTDDFVYIEATIYDYGDNSTKNYSLDHETFNEFKNLLNNTISTVQS